MFPPGTRVVTPRCNAVTQKMKRCYAKLRRPSSWWLWSDLIASVAQSPNARRVCRSCSSSAMLLSERRTSSANGACGRQERHDSAGMRLPIADHGWRSRVRRSTAWVVRQAGQRTHRNQCLPLSAQPIVGENGIGMRLVCRSFHAAMRPPASSRIWASVGRFACRFVLRGCRVLCFHLAAVEGFRRSGQAASQADRVYVIQQRCTSRSHSPLAGAGGNTCHSQCFFVRL